MRALYRKRRGRWRDAKICLNLKMKKVKNKAFILLTLLLSSACGGNDGIQENLSNSIDFMQCRLASDKSLCLKAVQGDAVSQVDLGDIYYNGNGVPRSYEKAAYWFEKSAAKGYDRAQNNLGLLYLFGNGVKKSREKAIALFKKAAEQGNKSSLLFAKLKYDERDIYADRLVEEIGTSARLSYPEQAKDEGHQGIVKLKFYLSEKGVISDIAMLKSSGYSELDQAAINAVQQLQKIADPPEGFPSTLVVPIYYKLSRSLVKYPQKGKK